MVHENQRVRAGQVLFTLDSRPTEVEVQRAAAQLADVRLQIRQDEAAYRQTLAQLAAAEEAASYRERDRARDAALLGGRRVQG